jgi:tetratricopeptide (TPR) repeat protein
MLRNIAVILFLSIFIASCGSDDYYNIATFHAKNGDYEKAIEYFTKAIDKNPKDAEAYYSRGYSRQTINGDNELVIADYTKSLEYNPNDHEAFMNRGVAKMGIRKTSEAIEDYKKSIEINPNNPIVYANLGNAFKLKYDNENACLNWGKSLELGNESVRQRIELNCK